MLKLLMFGNEIVVVQEDLVAGSASGLALSIPAMTKLWYAAIALARLVPNWARNQSRSSQQGIGAFAMTAPGPFVDRPDHLRAQGIEAATAFSIISLAKLWISGKAASHSRSALAAALRAFTELVYRI